MLYKLNNINMNIILNNNKLLLQFYLLVKQITFIYLFLIYMLLFLHYYTGIWLSFEFIISAY